MADQAGAADWPLVSIIFPIRNEADFIERCLSSVRAGDYPPERMELLVVDGMSSDGTREIVQRIAAADPRVRLLDNPARIVPHAMNAGIRAARGEIIIRIDGHATVNADFVRASVAELRCRPEVWCAGGPVETINESYVGRAIAAAMTSPVGVGNAMFRLGGYEGYVDTLAFGAYWKWVFDRIGLFDEELVRNQDDELNLRVILAGGKIYMTPRIRSQYYARSSLAKLGRQYYQYGYWRIRTIQKHKRPATLRQVAPLLFVAVYLALLLLAVVGGALWWPLGLPFGAFTLLYVAGLLAGAADVARKQGCAEALLAPVIFTILHFCYGMGSLVGVWVFVVRGGRGLRRPEEQRMSR